MRNTSKIIDITGQKYNHLTVVGIASRNPIKWECLCDCGNKTVVSTQNLKRGKVKSCGCIHHKGNPKHNQCYTRVYRIYAKIRRRCLIEDDPAYSNYGGRGITMCDEWLRSFDNFSQWAYSHGYQDNLSIERIDNNKGYSPDNCRWATQEEQSNNRRTNRVFTFDGKTMNLKQWCDMLDLYYPTIHTRISRGWSFEEAILHNCDARIIKRGKGEK